MIKSLIRKEMINMIKEKGTFFWLIGMPIAFMLIFSTIFSNADNQTINVHYIDLDQTAFSKQFIQQIDKIKSFEATADATSTVDEVVKRIKAGKQTSLLVIPKGFEQSLNQGNESIELYRDAAQSTSVAPIQAVLHQISAGYQANKLQTILHAIGKKPDEIKQMLTSPLQVKDIEESTVPVKAVTQYVPGYTVMFVFFIIITMVRNFIKDKESGMLARLLSTPLKPFQYLVGMWIPNVIAVIIQSAVLLGFGRLAFGLQLGNIWLITLIVLSLSICVTGLGLAISMIVKSENQGIAYTQIIAMGGAVIGGLWFPFDFLPHFLQVIGHFSPQYWAQHAFQNVMIHGAHFSDIWQTFAILLAFGLVGLIIGIIRFKKFMLSAIN